MKKSKLSNYLLFISLMTFLAIFFVVATHSYENLVKSSNEALTNPLGKNINLDLDIDVINLIEKRQKSQSPSNL